MGTTRYPVTINDNETLNLSAELSSPGLTAGASLRIDEDAGQTVTLTVTTTDLVSDGNPVALPPGVKLKITPVIPADRGATETADWTITPDEIDLGGTATITIVNDMLEEGPESVTFEVGFDDHAAFQAASATLTINDDEYTGPVLQSAAIDAAELTLEFSNTLDTGSQPARSAFTVKVRGTTVNLSFSNPVSISGSTVTLRLRSAVTAGDTVTVSYTTPGSNPIQDACRPGGPVLHRRAGDQQHAQRRPHRQAGDLRHAAARPDADRLDLRDQGRRRVGQPSIRLPVGAVRRRE